MTTATYQSYADARPIARADARDLSIDTMRGLAILMVVGIHSIQQPLATAPAIVIDALLRPCVPIFLFASGFLTARSGRVALGKRFRTALIPYTIAFIAAYIYMALHNPAMDHRITTTAARYLLAYVFVYYYVFVYLGCTVMLWLTLRIAGQNDRTSSSARLPVLLFLAIAAGLICGSYLDPFLAKLGASESAIQEARLRDLPFWFSFVASGMLAAMVRTDTFAACRTVLIGSTLFFFVLYAAVRALQIGDSANYDSIAFFGYAASLCMLLLALQLQVPWLATLGSGSYFVYLAHIFVIMAMRDHAPLHAFGAVVDSVATCLIAVAVSIVALSAIRKLASPRLVRWLGA